MRPGIASVAAMMNQRPASRSYLTFGPNVFAPARTGREERVGREVQHAVGRARGLEKLRMRPLAARMNCVGPAAPLGSGGSDPGLAKSRADESLQEGRRLGRVERARSPALSGGTASPWPRPRNAGLGTMRRVDDHGGGGSRQGRAGQRPILEAHQLSARRVANLGARDRLARLCRPRSLRGNRRVGATAGEDRQATIAGHSRRRHPDDFRGLDGALATPGPVPDYGNAT